MTTDTRSFRPTLLMLGLAATSLWSTFSLGQQAAPVPAAVAIPRPAPAEVTALISTFDTFKKTLPADTQALLAEYPELIKVRVPGINTAIVPDLSPRFVEKHQANLAVAKAGDIDLLFMGDSITDFWRNPEGAYAGKPVFDKNWGTLKTANFGIAGDTTQGVLYRLQHGEGTGFSPKAVMLMIGTNNTRNNSAAEIAEGVGAIVQELQKDFPAAKILLLAIFPRSSPVDPVRSQLTEVNNIIAKLDDNKKVFYMDIGNVFLDAQGNIGVDIMSDGLHPTTKGYELWAGAVSAKIAELMK